MAWLARLLHLEPVESLEVQPACFGVSPAPGSPTARGAQAPPPCKLRRWTLAPPRGGARAQPARAGAGLEVAHVVLLRGRAVAGAAGLDVLDESPDEHVAVALVLRAAVAQEGEALQLGELLQQVRRRGQMLLVPPEDLAAVPVDADRERVLLRRGGSPYFPLPRPMYTNPWRSGTCLRDNFARQGRDDDKGTAEVVEGELAGSEAEGTDGDAELEGGDAELDGGDAELAGGDAELELMSWTALP